MKLIDLEILNLEQGSDEWSAWRDSGCGASDVRVIKGKSPYKTRWLLWAEKLGIRLPEDLSRDPNVQRGNFFEPLVLETVAMKLGVTIDVYCGFDKDKPWRKVSFDGVIRGLNVPVEIKCPTSKSGECSESISEEDKETSRFWDLVEHGQKSKLFEEHYDQVQYQIGMLNAPYGYLVFYFSKINKLKIYKVIRDDNLITENFELVDKFVIEHIQPAIPPEKDKELDYYEPTEQELVDWDSQTLELIQVLKNERKLMKELRELKDDKKSLTSDLMSKASGYKQLMLHAVKINTVKGRETFQFEEFLASKGIEITEEDRKKFTKVGKPSARISIVKDSNLLQEVENNVINNQKKALAQQLFGLSDPSEIDETPLEELDDYYIS
ncbi:lambda-exonuclease family protein [Vibrio sp. THAF190c]|uniref:lambda-exonuclease family protein n=1 Tax=Vibrio sp. THAF190c TaxID=2587865 RepID=UPI0012698416|nr:YqaJ viral recombinase family protein [Vibrio sp. THAF190c]QFT13386.1 YqaJ-like viral recombinase domain protein [Vibrio sp. THAF190c]